MSLPFAKTIFRLVVGGALLFGGRLARTQANGFCDPAGWQKYRSSDYGLAIAYPDNMTVYADRPDYGGHPATYIPICNLTSVACFAYEGGEYKGTNFEGAGLSVNILRDIRTANECNDIHDLNTNAVHEARINAIRFHYAVTGEGAMNQWERGRAYRTLRNGVCFEIVIGVAGAIFEALDRGTVTEFNSAKLDNELNAMLHTFRFVGPVVDGPGWKVYDGSYCGETFEYPDGDMVVDSSQYPAVSEDIVCEAYFVHGGQKYKVETKRNQDADAFETWLKSAHYPDSSRPRLVLRGEDYTIYRVGLSYYLFVSRNLFMFSMSDSEGTVDPEGDPVMRHLLKSFRAY